MLTLLLADVLLPVLQVESGKRATQYLVGHRRPLSEGGK
jgi:hypothetical protein